MGCCSSVPSPSHSPYPTAQEASSSRAINPSVSAIARPATVHTNASSAQQPAPRSLTEHFNKPLRLHTWSSKDRVWTRSELDQEREAFFDTRVTGREEIWLTLKSALNILWGSSLAGEEDRGNQEVEGLGTAQIMLEAAGITIPTGDLSNGVYDALGGFYALPEWVVADPINLADDIIVEESEAKVGLARDNESEGTQMDEDEMMKRREDKGKAVVAEEDLIKVKARLSDRGGPDVVVKVGKEDSVRSVTRRVFEDSGLVSPRSIRLVYMGKMLKDTDSLTAQGWQNNHVINAFVFG